VSWKKALLVPKVARLARRAPRDTAQRWNAYWGAVRATGPDGDVCRPSAAGAAPEPRSQHTPASQPSSMTGRDSRRGAPEQQSSTPLRGRRDAGPGGPVSR
jgi:pyruvate/2-oxoglutarate dehydrogenase complex dihydrolipoamide acyltransferase (E2) component